jgi:hypothetical protein
MMKIRAFAAFVLASTTAFALPPREYRFYVPPNYRDAPYVFSPGDLCAVQGPYTPSQSFARASRGCVQLPQRFGMGNIQYSIIELENSFHLP